MKHSLPLLALASATALGACASAVPPEGPAPIATSADRHRINVAQTAQRLDVPVAVEDRTLSPEVRATVLGFGQRYRQGGHGALIISAPSGGANADAAALVAHQTRLALVEAGVPFAAVAGAAYDASGLNDAPIVLSYTTYTAEAPECRPLYEQDLAHQSNNQPWESFGCATQANLAAMIEDPRDLVTPRDETPRDSGRRTTVFDAYRAGDTTHAERSADERVAVSDAVE